MQFSYISHYPPESCEFPLFVPNKKTINKSATKQELVRLNIVPSLSLVGDLSNLKMADLSSLSNSELREKLLEYGYDIPSSVSKDFLLKKLQMVIKEPAKTGTGRKSVGRLSKVPTPPAPVRPVSIVPPSNASVTRRSTGRQLPARNNEREEQLNNSRITTKPPVGRSRNSTPPRIPARSPSRRSQPQQPQIHLGRKIINYVGYLIS